MISLGILGSTRGTNLAPIVDAIHEQRLDASIKIVASNQSHALILERACAAGLRAVWIDPDGLTRDQFDARVSNLFTEAGVERIVLTGYMRILSASFVTRWKNKIINVHPSLLPAFAGKRDLEVHRAVIAAGVPESGCSVHIVTADVDAGPVLLQKRCPVYSGDTPEILKTRVQALEGPALVEVLKFIRNLDYYAF